MHHLLGLLYNEMVSLVVGWNWVRRRLREALAYNDVHAAEEIRYAAKQQGLLKYHLNETTFNSYIVLATSSVLVMV